MTDLDYLSKAEQLLARVEACCDLLNEQTDSDIDNQRAGSMVCMTFAGGSQIVVNLQKPLQEVWLAARSGGYHYRLGGDGRWLDTKGQGEFYAQLSRCASEQSGQPMTFTEPIG
jgi:CyaY protein